MFIVIKWNAQNGWYAFRFKSLIKTMMLSIVAEEAPHWKRHSDHRVPGARRSPLHPEGYSLSLSTCLHHRTGARSLLWQHMLQVGLFISPAGIPLLGNRKTVYSKCVGTTRKTCSSLFFFCKCVCAMWSVKERKEGRKEDKGRAGVWGIWVEQNLFLYQFRFLVNRTTYQSYENVSSHYLK